MRGPFPPIWRASASVIPAAVPLDGLRCGCGHPKAKSAALCSYCAAERRRDPDAERVAVALSMGFSVESLAERMGVTPARVRTLRDRAKGRGQRAQRPR